MRLSRLALPLLAVVLASVPARAADLPKLTKDEQAMLADLSPEVVTEVAEMAAKVDELKKQLDKTQKAIKAYQAKALAAKKQVEDLKAKVEQTTAEAMGVVDAVNAVRDKEFDPAAVQDLVKLLLPLAEKAELEKKCKPYAELVKKVRKVEAEVKQLEEKVKADLEAEVAKVRAKVKAVQADTEALKQRGEEYRKQFDDLAVLAQDEEKLRAVVEQRLRVELQEQIAQSFGPEVIDALNAMKNPTAFAKSFAEGQFKEFLAKSEIDITKQLKAKLLTKEPKKSVFAGDNDLLVEIKYKGGFSVQATGFGFRYVDQAPFVEPYFDESKATVTADGRKLLADVLGKGIEGLGDLLPLGKLPVSLRPLNLDDKFRPGTPLRCEIGLNLGDVLPVSLKGTVDISPARIEVVGKIEVEAKLPKEYVEIPGTPVAIFTVGGSVDVEKKSLTVKATLAAAAPKADKALAFDVALTVDFPIKTIKVDGSLLVGGQSVCDVEGWLGELPKEKGGGKGLALGLIIPGKGGAAAVKGLVNGKADLTLTKEGLTAKGNFELAKAFKTKFDLAVTNAGSGHFTGSWDQNMFGVKVDADITARFDKGFSNLDLETNFTIGVDLGDLLSADVVAVRLTVKGGVIIGVAYGFGMSVGFELDTNSDLVAIVTKKLKEKVGEFAEKVADALKECDPFNKNSFAAYATRNMDPFNKNSAAARFTKEFDPTNKNSKAYQLLTQLDPANAAAQLEKMGVKVPKPPSPQKVGDNIQNGLNDLGNGRLPNVWGKVDPPSGADLLSAVTLLQGGGERSFVERLQSAVVDLQTIDDEEVMPPTVSASPVGRTVRRSRVHVRVLAPTLVAPNDTTFVIGFVVKACGSASTVQPGKKPERLTGSEAVGGGSIVLTRQPDGKWKGKINQPKLNWANYCYQDRSLWLSQELETRLEAALPEVQVDGLRLFGEKGLVVTNKTKSDLTVHVQRRTKVSADAGKREWKWLPGDPADGLDSYHFKVKAGEKVRLTNRVVDPAAPRERVTVTKVLGKEVEVKVPIPEIPLNASRVRIWADADDGEDWDTYRGKDFWLIDENPKMKGERVYQAEAMADATFNFLPKSGFRTYDERVIGFTNATAKPVLVAVEFRATEDGKTTWRKLPQFEVPAGETVRPRDKAGQLVRASAIKFVAVSEQFGYREHQDKPLWVVAETDGLRLYKAEKVGTYTHTLRPAEAIKPGGDK